MGRGRGGRASAALLGAPSFAGDARGARGLLKEAEMASSTQPKLATKGDDQAARESSGDLAPLNVLAFWRWSKSAIETAEEIVKRKAARRGRKGKRKWESPRLKRHSRPSNQHTNNYIGY